jgi:phage N-6-adenine-methyltransferase
MNNHQLINQTSGRTEWYTPPEIIEAARRTMGEIDLDPASSEHANLTVLADRIYTEANNGLLQSWEGNVWLNHPFSRQYNADWINKLISEYENGNIDQACCITYASTSEQWFRPLMSYPICFIHGRTNYIDPDTGKPANGVTKGSCVTYLGDNVDRFAYEFRELGTVLVPHAAIDHTTALADELDIDREALANAIILVQARALGMVDE